MPDIIDLDALAPPSAILRFNGQEITVKPPKLGDALKLAAAAEKMVGPKGKKREPAQMQEALDEIKTHIDTMIPEFAGQDLTMDQLLAVTKAISNMIVPPDAKELKERGITVDTADPKVE